MHVDSRPGARASMPMLVALTAALLAAGGRRSSGSKSCEVVSTWPDGREEVRDCEVLGDKFLAPGTKGRFESCTA